MLHNKEEAEIMKSAQQKGLRLMNGYKRQPFVNIVEDFLHDKQFLNRIYCDIGAGQWDFADLMLERGGSCVGVDRDEAVLNLGSHRGHIPIEKHYTLNPLNIKVKFDGVFSRASFNPFNFHKKLPLLEDFINSITGMMKGNGWGLIVPWLNNASELSDEEVIKFMDGCFKAKGFRKFILNPTQQAKYGLNEKGRIVYVKNILWESGELQFDGMRYKEFINLLPKEYIKPFPKTEEEKPEKAIYLRHDTDTDNNLRQSYLMAKIEKDAGLKSVFYVLHGREYWGKPETWKLLREIQDMGHEIGFHNQVVTEVIEEFNITPSEEFTEEHNEAIKQKLTTYLKQMRDEGLIIRGTSGHGHETCYTHEYHNHSVLNCFKPEKGIKQYDLSDFGLEYDAMAVKRDVYFSDSGCKWCVSSSMLTGNGRSEKVKSEEVKPEEVINDFKKQEKQVLQINIHPQWWL